ncbi:MAG: Acyl-CoA dehydrogenase/oxidase domain protein, partial [uncultured Rubrobacteraceae bacterium]
EDESPRPQPTHGASTPGARRRPRRDLRRRRGRGTGLPGGVVPRARGLRRPRHDRAGTRVPGDAPRLLRKRVARAARRGPRGRLGGTNPGRPLQRRGAPLRSRAGTAADVRAGGGRRRRAAPWGLGRGPGSGRRRAGPPRRRRRARLGCEDVLLGLDGPRPRGRPRARGGRRAGPAAGRLRGPLGGRKGGYYLVPRARDALLGEPPGSLCRGAGAGGTGASGRALARALLLQGRRPHGRHLGRHRGPRGGLGPRRARRQVREPGAGRPRLARGRQAADRAGHHRPLAGVRRRPCRRRPGGLALRVLDPASGGRRVRLPGRPGRGLKSRRLSPFRHRRPPRPGEAGPGALSPAAPPGAGPRAPGQRSHRRTAPV